MIDEGGWSAGQMSAVAQCGYSCVAAELRPMWPWLVSVANHLLNASELDYHISNFRKPQTQQPQAWLME
jgi:hypothetical protein